MERNLSYSFGWTQSQPGDVSAKVINTVSTIESVKDMMDAFIEMGKNGYNGFMCNWIMADN